MSIYATYWALRFPRYGDAHAGCEWVTVLVEAVPAHCGPDSASAPDPFEAFLPRFEDSVERDLRAIVFVVEGTPKEGQQYVEPLLVLSARQYFATPFHDLVERICSRLRGDRPRWLSESVLADGRVRVLFEDGSAVVVDAASREH